MNPKQSLYEKALLAWRQELKAQLDSILKDKQTNLHDRMQHKIEEMFGLDYPIEIETASAQDNPVLGAVVDGLNLLAVKGPSGAIIIVLLVPCLRCGYQMASKPLTRLADLGRELLEFEMKGTIGEHECSADVPPLDNTHLPTREI